MAQALEEMGKLINMPVICISGNNGTSAEGTTIITLSDLTLFAHGNGARRTYEVPPTAKAQ